MSEVIQVLVKHERLIYYHNSIYQNTIHSHVFMLVKIGLTVPLGYKRAHVPPTRTHVGSYDYILRGVLTPPAMLRSYQFKNKTKSVTRTVRIDEDIDFQLEKLAHEQRVSVNYFCNQALRKFVEWDVFADRLGFVTLPSDIFEKLVGFTTDEQAKELGAWFGKNLAKDLIAFLFKRVDLETSVRALELLGPRYGKAFRFEYTNDGHLTTVILNHGFGRKASVFYSEAVKALLKDLVNTQVDIGLSEHQVFAQIVGPNEFRITMPTTPVVPLPRP